MGSSDPPVSASRIAGLKDLHTQLTGNFYDYEMKSFHYYFKNIKLYMVAHSCNLGTYEMELASIR